MTPHYSNTPPEAPRADARPGAPKGDEQQRVDPVRSEMDALAGKREDDVTREEAQVRQGDRNTWNFRILFLSTVGAGALMLLAVFAWPDDNRSSEPQRPETAGGEVPASETTAPSGEDELEAPD